MVKQGRAGVGGRHGGNAYALRKKVAKDISHIHGIATPKTPVSMIDPATGLPFKSARKAALAARKARRKQAVENALSKK